MGSTHRQDLRAPFQGFWNLLVAHAMFAINHQLSQAWLLKFAILQHNIDEYLLYYVEYTPGLLRFQSLADSRGLHSLATRQMHRQWTRGDDACTRNYVRDGLMHMRA